MKNKSRSNCVEIQLPSKGLKDKKGFPVKRTLYANHLLVLFEKAGQSVIFETISKLEYYITGCRIVSPQDNRAYYFCFCNKALKDFKIYLDTTLLQECEFRYYKRSKAVVITFNNKENSLKRDCLARLAVLGKELITEETPACLVRDQYLPVKAFAQVIDYLGQLQRFCNGHSHQWTGVYDDYVSF
jgi:hypothetical protein